MIKYSMGCIKIQPLIHLKTCYLKKSCNDKTSQDLVSNKGLQIDH